MSSKQDALERVHQAAEAYRLSQHATQRARERFVDSLMDARAAKATYEELAHESVIVPNDPGKHVSRQRVAQFMNERKPAPAAGEGI